MATSGTPTVPLQKYLAALRAATELEAPYGAALFTILTALVRPHELLRPATCCSSGRLLLPDGPASEGPSHGRDVPLARVTASVLAHDGPLLGSLGLRPGDVTDVIGDLQRAMLDHDDLADVGSAQQAWAIAVAAAVTAAQDLDGRTAVLAYSGVHAAGRRAEKRRGALIDADFQRVADTIDGLAAAAGVVIPVHAAAVATA